MLTTPSRCIPSNIHPSRYRFVLNKMRTFQLSLALFVVASSALFAQVYGARSAYCTKNLNGTGDPDPKTTRYCCDTTREHSSTAFWSRNNMCLDGAGLGNGINLGRFVKCCGDQGAGSHSDG